MRPFSNSGLRERDHDSGLVGVVTQCRLGAQVVVSGPNFGLPAVYLSNLAPKLPVLPQLLRVRRRLHSHTWGTEGPHPRRLAVAAV